MLSRYRRNSPPKPRALGERGASAVEYALLIAGIAAVLVITIVLLGGTVRDLFTDTCVELDRSSASGDCP
jgi:pilus assembly protein Flp/PilA